MNFMKIATVVLGLAFAGVVGCGSDGGNGGGTGGTIIGGTGGAGGSVGMDATPGIGGSPGTGGAVSVDAAGGAGGSVSLDGGGAGGSVTLDANVTDASMVVDGVGSISDGGGSETGAVSNICTGLSAAACDLLIRNPDPATLPATISDQDVPGPTPPAYSVCSAQ